jgi:cytosine/uracil/thiamine/allantoin permease
MIRYKIKEKIKGIKPKIEEILKSIKFVLNRIGFVAFSCLLVIMILIIFKKITLIEVVTRLVTFMIFWVLVLIVIFGPRRYLLKSRTFKYICLIVLKKYPVIYYYRRALTGVLTP